MPAELISYTDEALKQIVTGLFATWLLILIGAWFMDFIMKAGRD